MDRVGQVIIPRDAHSFDDAKKMQGHTQIGVPKTNTNVPFKSWEICFSEPNKSKQQQQQQQPLFTGYRQ